jgi:aryl-alcohol dehydrogenase-like predicted oxidoreductase
LETRPFGRSGLRLSVLGFGCGAVGGLMVRGDPLDQERTVARAIDAGVSYFDTAVQYGNGESEQNLGRILQKLKPRDVVVGTKVRLPPEDFGRIGDAITQSLDASLARLRRWLRPLVEEGLATSLTEAATRFALSHPAVGTILVGTATPQEFEDALAAVEQGPLPAAARERLTELRNAFAGEPR